MSRLRRTCAVLGGLALALTLALPSARARFARSEPVPVERIVRSLEQRIADEALASPYDHYLLGRAHAFAFYRETSVLIATPYDEGVDVPAELAMQEMQLREVPLEKRLEPDQVLHHLSEAVRVLRAALALDLDQGSVEHFHPQFHLGLAFVLEEGRALAPQVDTAELFDIAPPADADARAETVERLAAKDESVWRPALETLRADLEASVESLNAARAHADPAARARIAELLRLFWTERAIDAYRAAYDQRLEEELAYPRIEAGPLQRGLEALTSYEAGHALLRLVRERGVRDAAEEQFLEEVEANLRALAEKPIVQEVTPIVFSLAAPLPLEALLARDHPVLFDLDGDGVDEAWPWVTGETAILVWDPTAEGVITSGRQLFGSVTWWMLFPDGYRALDALDEDRDGWLRGRELTGLAVWHDTNGDGASSPAEVEPVGEAGILGLSTESTGRADASLANPCGLELSDGRRLPTYDWITAPVPVP